MNPDIVAPQTSEPGEIRQVNEPAGDAAAAGEMASGTAAPGTAEPPRAEVQTQLQSEIDRLIARMEEETDYKAPAFTPQGLLRLLEENAGRFEPEVLKGILEKLRSSISADLLDLDTWKGIWYVVNYSLQAQADTVRRRVRGEYETDDWGLDADFVAALQPFLSFLYRTYWRVETTGMENVPAEGAALLTSNHSGQLPWDGAMLGTSVYLDHPAQRIVRALYATWFPTLPFIAPTLTKMGQALATVDNGTRLLQEGNLVAVFPEGYKGVGKLFRDRYRLARFGRGGFVKMALRTGAPIIPVSVVGAEETYVSLYKSETMARLTGFPYFPISLTFPLLGPLGFVPLPTKWYIDFGTPIPTAEYGPEAANNLVLVSQLTDQIRNVVQDMIYQRLDQRRSVFLG